MITNSAGFKEVAIVGGVMNGLASDIECYNTNDLEIINLDSGTKRSGIKKVYH